MNKKLFMLAAAATAFAACSSEVDSLGSPEIAQSNTEVAAQTPVLFDAYTNRALTRAGAEGVLTTAELKTNGFGVFGYYTENELYNDTYKPTFMYNTKVYMGTDDWTYSPVKYWPNEFGSAAESEDVDRLSFFAYAPYVHVDPSTGIPDGGQETAWGITAMTRNSATGDPFVKYAVNFDPAHQVDFTWGVAKDGAPSAVTGATQATIAAGSPFKDLVKPGAGEKVAFKFNHALAQLNVKVDAKVDDDVDIQGDYSRIWVRSVTFEGFATKGAFNLNQAADADAAWTDVNGNNISSGFVTVYDGRSDGKEGVSAASNEVGVLNSAIVQATAYTVDADNKVTAPAETGVTKTAVNLFNSTTDTDALFVIPNQQNFKVTIVYDVETVDPKLPTYLADGVTKGSRVQNTISQDVTFGASDVQLVAGKKYMLTLHLGMRTVTFDAAVTGWDDTTAEEEAHLPINQGTYTAPVTGASGFGTGSHSYGTGTGL